MNKKLDGSALQQAEDFVYLAGTISADCSCDKDVMRKIVIMRKLQLTL